MTSGQTAFTKKGLGELETGLTREDLILKREMKAQKVLCPYCLQYGTLWDFHTRLKNKRGKHFISMSRCKCPYCFQGFTKKTLLKIAVMPMEEFADWFWGQMFEGWGFGDKVAFPIFKKRLKDHYDYATRQIFWDIYWEYKDATPKGKEAREDQAAYDDYRETVERQTREDYEDYSSYFEEEP